MRNGAQRIEGRMRKRITRYRKERKEGNERKTTGGIKRRNETDERKRRRNAVNVEKKGRK